MASLGQLCIQQSSTLEAGGNAGAARKLVSGWVALVPAGAVQGPVSQVDGRYQARLKQHHPSFTEAVTPRPAHARQRLNYALTGALRALHPAKTGRVLIEQGGLANVETIERLWQMGIASPVTT